MAAVTRWLHFNESVGDQWVLPILAAANAAAEAKKVDPVDKGTLAVGLHISTKLNILPRVFNRINQEAVALYEAAKQHEPEHVFTKGKEGYAFQVDDDLKYNLIADIEAFLFEADATWGLMKRLVRHVYFVAGHKISDDDVRDVINKAHAREGLDCGWVSLLDRDRNFVAHDGAGYLAIDISDNDHWELLVMKDNVVEFDKPKKFFTLSDLMTVNRGFLIAKRVIQIDLIALFK